MTARIEPSLLGKMSERQVLRILQSHGPLSRADVARHTGLSAPAVSRAVAALLRLGLLEETNTPQATGGRPANRLRLATCKAQVLGAAIDADRCLVVSAGLDGLFHEESHTFDTPDNYAELLRCLAETARVLMKRPGVATLGLGLSLPGLIDYRSGRSVLSPNLPLTNGQTPARDLADRLGLDCIVLQESHALCLAEQHHGLARGLDDFAMLDVQTGVGLGVVTGGRLLTGHSGMAGELGHITVVPGGLLCGCGNNGCLETVASDTSLARRISQRIGRSLSIEEMLALLRSKADDFNAEVDDYSRYLALACAAVINLFNPSRLFLHGRVFDADPKLFARTVERVERRSLEPTFQDCRIVRATAEKHQGAVAGIISHLTSAIAPALLTNPLGLLSEIRHALPSA